MSSSPEDPASPEDNLALGLDNLCSRYVGLHLLVEDNQNSFSRLICQSFGRKVEHYLDDLAQAFGKLPFSMPPEIRDTLWCNFLSRDKYNKGTIVSVWELDFDLKAEFIRLAFFHQHPEFAGAEHPISLEKMLTALAAPCHAVAKDFLTAARPPPPNSEHIKILKEGYDHEYLRNKTIVTPTLKRLSNNDKAWDSTKYLAPYTALIAPSMRGKTRLLMKLSETVCVVYICLLPGDSTGQPPRSVLADEMELPNKRVEGLLVHYYRLLAAIFDVVAEFFSNQSADSDEKDCLLDPIAKTQMRRSYGTPFFRIYVDGAKKPERSMSINVIVQNVRTMAIDKLLCFPSPSQDLSKGQIFTLLGCTIQPQIYEAARLDSELVLSHLAQCLYILPTGERLISEYPSQFTLSMAANSFLTEMDSRLISCIEALTKFIQQGLILSGHAGELATRIILLQAIQKAMSTFPIRTNQSDIPYGCSVLLEDFLKTLIVQAKNDLVKFEEEGPKWNSKYAGVKLQDNVPYLFILFSFKTSRTKYTLPPIPQRGSLIFHGLDQIKCLTPKISSALKELLSVYPDIWDFHKDDKDLRRCIENTRAAFYRLSDCKVDLNCDLDDGIDVD
ncbi:hypothetical protein PGT21_019494 [Puccinia graminis f. sp. tritici]|uniref:Uncharacterized protein n=1 Tax=Puccinia graminis f. sp. tritici TaxID=56615 RepID=A0A5B0MN37_PUCGR|nr:hypothetical protein PGT21_019494 [Puccinia graminis f. sp. tritici]